MRVWVETIRTSPGRVFTQNIVGRNQSTAVICILGNYSIEKREEAYRYADPVFLLHDVHQIVLYLVNGVVPGGVFLSVWKEEEGNYLDYGEALKHGA